MFVSGDDDITGDFYNLKNNLCIWLLGQLTKGDNLLCPHLMRKMQNLMYNCLASSWGQL